MICTPSYGELRRVIEPCFIHFESIRNLRIASKRREFEEGPGRTVAMFVNSALGLSAVRDGGEWDGDWEGWIWCAGEDGKLSWSEKNLLWYEKP
jgi:hypothetical protein